MPVRSSFPNSIIFALALFASLTAGSRVVKAEGYVLWEENWYEICFVGETGNAQYEYDSYRHIDAQGTTRYFYHDNGRGLPVTIIFSGVCASDQPYDTG